MPCNQDVGHLTNNNFNFSEFITNYYFHSIEVGLEVSKASLQIFDSFLVDGHSVELRCQC